MKHPSFSTVSVYAPATVANVACAFDVLGFALDTPGDTVTIEVSSQSTEHRLTIRGDGGKLPTDPDKNTALVAIHHVLRELGNPEIGLQITLQKNMPLGSGLGSSAASAVAGALAINHLFGSPLTKFQLLPAILEAERTACGAAHADNGAPSLLGGFVLIRSYSPLDVVPLTAPPELYATVIHPEIEIRTEDARRVLKRDLSLKSAIIQWGNTAGLIAGLLTHDYGLIGRSLSDVVIEPERAVLIPGFERVKQQAIDAGALGCSISGSGPSIFALARGQTVATQIGDAMQEVFTKLEIHSSIIISPINTRGAYVQEAR